jgi:predicted lipid-binding transport protein (Tim44 family)
MEILFFAVVAALVLGRLYQVLGQNRGAEPPPLRERRGDPTVQSGTSGFGHTNQDEGLSLEQGDTPLAAPQVDASPLGLGLAEIRGRDRGFDPDAFLVGASAAYEMIVTAYGRGDEATLRTLVNDEVFTAYQAAIAARKEAGAAGIEVVQISESSLRAAEMEGTIARIDVHFSANLQDGGDGLRPTDEVWTFERDTLSRKPDWILVGVDAG